MKKYQKILLIVIIFVIVVFFIYLNRVYANIYRSIGHDPLPAQNKEVNYEIKGNLALSSQPLVYVALGDSLTAGVGAENFQQSWPYLISMAMAPKYNQVKLVNLGTPAAKSIDVLNNQLPVAISLKPDYVTLLIGVNDMHNLVPLADLQKNITSIINQLQNQTHAEIVLTNAPYIGGSKLFLLPYQWYFNWQTHRYNEVFVKICKAEKVKCVDLYSPNSQLQKQPGFYSSDNFHPSAEGYLQWSKIIYAN